MKRGPMDDARRTPLPPDAVKRLVRARMDGLTWPELAQRFGRSQRQVRHAYARATAEELERLLRPSR